MPSVAHHKFEPQSDGPSSALIRLAKLLAPAMASTPHVVDIGANPIDGDPPYKSLLGERLCSVTGFEPQPLELERLLSRKSDLETYLPDAIFDGDFAELKVCAASGMSSLLEPSHRHLALFIGMAPFAQVRERMPIGTTRLDDVDQIDRIDFLKMDIQGGELKVLRHGRHKLRNCVAAQLEVSFVPLYKDQPCFGEIDLEMRSQGFIPHRFVAVKNWSVARTMLAGQNGRHDSQQLLEADVVYIRDLAYLERLSAEQLAHLALILFGCYGSRDVPALCLAELVHRHVLPQKAFDEFNSDLPN